MTNSSKASPEWVSRGSGCRAWEVGRLDVMVRDGDAGEVHCRCFSVSSLSLSCPDLGSVCMNDRLHALGRDMYTAVLPRKDYLLYLPFPVKHWVPFWVFTLHRLAPES